MTLFSYLKDKRYFILLYIVFMIFISLMLLINEDQRLAVHNIVYTNISCFLFVCIYIVFGYYYHRRFFRELSTSLHAEGETIFQALPASKTNTQQIYLKKLKELERAYTRRLQKLYDEKQDHQDFVLSWIHEVKQPIAMSFLIMERSEGKSTDYMVDKLEDEMQKIDSYVEQALYHSRIDAFSKDYFIEEASLNQIIKDSVKKYAKMFIHKQIRFTMEEKVMSVQTDSKWLAFIVDQILVNALKYTDEDGEISCHFEEDEKEKRMVIQDSGIGISQTDLPRVFEKGFTSSAVRNHTKSTGMGLFLAKQMTQKLNHDISIQSEEGKYTKVILSFPKFYTYRDF